MQAKGASTWPSTPGAPTIGTATAGSNKCASVAFTAPACTGTFPSGVTGYLVTSTPGCFTATGSSSPLTVTGLTAGTSYTFKAQATNGNGYGALSAASNSITATLVTCATYTCVGTFTWVAPAGVTSVAAVAVGGGGYLSGNGKASGGGGALAYRNSVTVTPLSSYTVVVGGAQSDSTVLSMVAGGGKTYVYNCCGQRQGTGGTPSGTYTGGGNGGTGGSFGAAGGGGGAGGYSGNGGAGALSSSSRTGSAGSGGGGGGGGAAACNNNGGGGGGGVGLYGQGSNGAAGTASGSVGTGGGAGSSGVAGSIGIAQGCGPAGRGGAGGAYGGGGGSGQNGGLGNAGTGAVRIVWCKCGARGTPSFPSTNVGA